MLYYQHHSLCLFTKFMTILFYTQMEERNNDQFRVQIDPMWTSHLAPNFSACELFAKARSEKYNCSAPITASGNASKRRGGECLG